jgi:hypothetical protein
MELLCPMLVPVNEPAMGFEKMLKIAHAREGKALAHDQVLSCKQLTLVNTCVLFSMRATGH